MPRPATPEPKRLEAAVKRGLLHVIEWRGNRPDAPLDKSGRPKVATFQEQYKRMKLKFQAAAALARIMFPDSKVAVKPGESADADMEKLIERLWALEPTERGQVVSDYIADGTLTEGAAEEIIGEIERMKR